MLQAGGRLAGELNKLLNARRIPTGPLPKTSSARTGLNLKPVAITAQKDIGSIVPINLSAAYPNQQLTLALKGAAKSLASKIDGKTIIIEGTVIDCKGKPEIIITDLTKITF